MHRYFLRKLSQNPESVQTHRNDRKYHFHLAFRRWYLYNNPQCCQKKSIFTRKKIRIMVKSLLYLFE